MWMIDHTQKHHHIIYIYLIVVGDGERCQRVKLSESPPEVNECRRREYWVVAPEEKKVAGRLEEEETRRTNAGGQREKKEKGEEGGSGVRASCGTAPQ
jgi:hypothetical protein